MVKIVKESTFFRKLCSEVASVSHPLSDEDVELVKYDIIGNPTAFANASAAFHEINFPKLYQQFEKFEDVSMSVEFAKNAPTTRNLPIAGNVAASLFYLKLRNAFAHSLEKILSSHQDI